MIVPIVIIGVIYIMEVIHKITTVDEKHAEEILV